MLADIEVQALKATKMLSGDEWLLDLPCKGALPRLTRLAIQRKVTDQLCSKLGLLDPQFSFTVDALETLLVFDHPWESRGAWIFRPAKANASTASPAYPLRWCEPSGDVTLISYSLPLWIAHAVLASRENWAGLKFSTTSQFVLFLAPEVKRERPNGIFSGLRPSSTE